ncbi:MAG: hypothetical protein NT027_05725 [Proteobacteria bacterium]|nr:hypothetical protein [Pseudomonadota bacterium]
MMSKVLVSILYIMIGLIASTNQSVFAGSLSLRTGPQQLGNGGSYPLFIPPASHQMALTWVTDSGFESTLSLYPGLLFGKRFQSQGLFLSLGGGLIISYAAGPGIYSTFGYETGSGSGGWHFTADYTQALGIDSSTKKYIAPSSMRLGVLWRY